MTKTKNNNQEPTNKKLTTMNRRSVLPAILIALLTSVASLFAADAPAFQYNGEITGVACAACSKKVKNSLQKLPGVSAVKVTASGTSGVAKLEITSTSGDITKESAILALGKEASSYQITSLSKEGTKK